MTYLMGVDGGGSTIRVAITTRDLQVVTQVQGPTVNPSVIGYDAASETIQMAMWQAIVNANLIPEQISAVGIGIAGAEARRAERWLIEVGQSILPNTLVVPSADYEIALVGAHGGRRGILVLAGTGSLAYGINSEGSSALVGGWGYLLGDEGGGYWLGLEGLKAAIRSNDGRGAETNLTIALLGALRIFEPRDLITWTYQSTPRSSDIAQLAPLVLAVAAQGDQVAREIVQRAADELALAAKSVTRQLRITIPQIAFAGGLLDTPNPLSQALCERLDMKSIPEPKYPPVIGAALLAKLAMG
jgi:glucosamine kinase